MFYAIPAYSILTVYILAAILPAAFLLRYIYKHDTIEKEPPALLFSLLMLGIVAALASIALETLGKTILSFFAQEGTQKHTILLAFFVVALVEEGTKLFFLKRKTWNHPGFNYRFDGIVYSVFVSLGFAAFENIMYVFSYGLSVAVSRALLAIPAHMGFAVFMGIFYGRAKIKACNGNKTGANLNIFFGYFMAVLLHGFYDACLLIGTNESTLSFAVFVILMYIFVIKLIKKEAASDRPL